MKIRQTDEPPLSSRPAQEGRFVVSVRLSRGAFTSAASAIHRRPYHHRPTGPRSQSRLAPPIRHTERVMLFGSAERGGRAASLLSCAKSIRVAEVGDL